MWAAIYLPINKESGAQGPGFDYYQRGFALLEAQKLQISNHKYQTISNDRNSKKCFVLKGFGHAQRRRLRRVLNIGISDLFVILDIKPQGSAIYL